MVLRQLVGLASVGERSVHTDVDELVADIDLDVKVGASDYLALVRVRLISRKSVSRMGFGSSLNRVSNSSDFIVDRVSSTESSNHGHY